MMLSPTPRRGVLAAIALSALIVFSPDSTRGDLVVAPGWDLYITPVVTIQGIQWQGVPYGTFDFGGAIGVQNVGNTDTVIQRTGVASTGNPATVEIIGLQLETVSNTENIGGAGQDRYFAILNGGQASAQNFINFTNDTGGKFTTSIPIDYQIRKGALNGTFVTTGTTSLDFTNENWGRIRPSLATAGPAVDDVNFELNNVNTAQDFWAGALAIESVPEPALALSTCIAIAGIGVVSLKRKLGRKKKDASSTAQPVI